MTVYDKLKLPESSYVNIPLEKFFIYEHSAISKENYSRINNFVNNVTIRYNLKPETTRLCAYKNDTADYPEIQIVEAELNSVRPGYGKYAYKDLALAIFNAIPYPLIIIFHYKTRYKFMMFQFHTGKMDESKNVAEQVVDSRWINLSDLKVRDVTLFESMSNGYQFDYNFRDLYIDWLNDIETHAESTMPILNEYEKEKLERDILEDYYEEENTFKKIAYVSDDDFGHEFDGIEFPRYDVKVYYDEGKKKKP